MPSEAMNAPQQPLISIIITNYNYASYLGDCIASALAQTYSNIEVIVVDDGSTDGSRDVISRFPKVKAIYRSNGGQAAALRAGLEASRGDIIQCLDSDDTFHPEACATIARCWTPDTAAIAARLAVIRADGAPNGEVIPPAFNHPASLDFMIEHGYLEAVPTSGMAFRRDLVERVCRDALHMDANGIDAYLTFCAPLFGRVQQIEDVIGSYRIHGDNVSLAAGASIKGLRAHVYIQYWAQMTFRKLARDMKGIVIEGPPRGPYVLQWHIMTADAPADRYTLPLATDIALAADCARSFLSDRTFHLAHRLRNAAFILFYAAMPRALRLRISRNLYA